MSPRSRRPERINTPASLGKVQTHDVARRTCPRRPPKGRPTDKLLQISTSANGADRKLDAADRGQRLLA